MELEEYLEKKYSKSSLKTNLYNIKRFTDYYQNKAKTADYQDVLNYINHLRKNYDLHPKTLLKNLYAIKIYFYYLLETGQRNDHPCSELFLKDKIDKQIQVDNLYSSETLENFLQTYQIKKKKHLENRNKIIISLLIYQALTVTEIANLELENIHLEKAEITIKRSENPNTKSPKARVLPLQAKQILLIYKYINEERPKLLSYSRVPPSGVRGLLLGQYGEKINPHGINKMINEQKPKSEQIQPQKIRQSVITNLLKKENDTRVVQVFSGHKTTNTTIQYKQTELEILQNAINNFHPVR